MRSSRPLIRGTRHACVAGHYLAAHAGFSVLERGGNAIDAGIAAAMVETVVQSEQVGFAGIVPMMAYLAQSREVVTLAGVGTWPAATSCEFFESRHAGHIPPGILRSVVPAAPAAWVKALRLFGTWSFADVASAALRLARDGFPIHAYNAEQIRRNAADYRRWPQNAAIFLPGGNPPAAGDRFVQADLANTIAHLVDCERAAAHKGRDAALAAVHDAFYKGGIADAIVAYHRDHGGWITSQDLAAYEVAQEPPVKGNFRGLEIHTCGFWSQGPTLVQMLNMLDGQDLRALGWNTSGYVHRLVETVKLAFADRYRYYADPLTADVPAHGLLSTEYALRRAMLVDGARASPGMPPPGDPVGKEPQLRGWEGPRPSLRVGASGRSLDTTYCCALDSTGNVFSASPSDTSSDTPVIPGTGFCVSARGTQAWGERGNINCAAPGRRPRVTPNPVMVLQAGRPVLALGTPGGDVQPQAMLQVLLNVVVFGMDPQEAVEAPRFVSWSFPNSREPHDYHEGLLALEGRFAPIVGQELAALGHRVSWWPPRTGRAGGVCALRLDPERGVFEAAADFRRAGYALGW